MRLVLTLAILAIATLAGCNKPVPATGEATATTDTTAAQTASRAEPQAGTAGGTVERSPANGAQSGSPVEPKFVDVAAEAGLTATLYCGGANKDHLLESTGSGAAFLDYDRDGRLDIYLVNAWALDEQPSQVREKGRNVLYRNVGEGRFEDVTERAGVGDDGWGCGVCTGDYDNDGHIDMYVTNFGANRLYRNRGDGTFEEVGEKAGVADTGWGAGASFFDADADGDLDLYLANYVDCTFEEVLKAERTTTWRNKVKVMNGPFGLRGGRDQFFRNQGDGTFVNATAEAGMTDEAESYGLGVLASDLDNDGDVDIYVANDSNTNFMYRNDGGGKFSEIGGWCGAGLTSEGRAQAGMGVDAADWDGDQLQEIFVTNFAQDYCTLYKNNGELFFTDVSLANNLKLPTYDPVSWGCSFLDFDQDADLDLLVLNGHIYPQVDSEPQLNEKYRQLQTLLRNDNGRLVEVSRSAGPGLQIPASARGVAVGDYDDDGDADLLITAIDAPPMLLRNDTPAPGHWLKLRLLNRHGSPALNAKALVTAGGKTQLAELRSGSTYQSQNASDLHFGLGMATQIDKLEIQWPDGQRTVQQAVPADRTLTVEQPAQ